LNKRADRSSKGSNRRNRGKNKKIKKQLITCFLFLSVIPVLVMGIINYKIQEKDNRKNLKPVNIQLVHSVSDQVQNYLFKSASSVESLSRIYDFSKIDPGKAQVILSSTAQDYPNLKQIDIYNLEGKPQFSSEKGGKNSAIDNKIFDRIKDDERFVSDTYEEEDVPIAVLYTSLKDNSNNINAIAAVHIKLDKLSEIMERYDTGTAYVINGDGEVLAHPDYEGKVVEKYNPIKNKIKGATLALQEEKGNGSNYRNDKNVEVLGTYVKVPLTNWGVIFEQNLNEVNSEAKKGLHRTLTMTIILIFFVVIFSNTIAKKFWYPLEQMVIAVDNIGVGDLTKKVTVDSNNEIGILQKSFNTMVDSLDSLMLSISTVSSNLENESGELLKEADSTINANSEISVVVEEAVSGAERQMIKAEKTSEVSRTMFQVVKDMEEQFSQILNSVKTTFDTAILGSEDINNTIKIMDSISIRVNEMSNQMSKLINHIYEIDKIAESINGVSRQTNLLALNAAIEAARVRGREETGKGFTIVAEEIRNLAEETEKASQYIGDIINKMKDETKLVVSSMNDNLLEIDKGNETIKKTGRNFNDIVEYMKKTTITVERFSSILEKMSARLEDIDEAIIGVNKTSHKTFSRTQTALASTEEQVTYVHSIKKSAENLKGMSEELGKVIEGFKID